MISVWNGAGHRMILLKFESGREGFYFLRDWRGSNPTDGKERITICLQRLQVQVPPSRQG